MPRDPDESEIRRLWRNVDRLREDGTAAADSIALVTGVLEAVGPIAPDGPTGEGPTDLAGAAIGEILGDQDWPDRLLSALIAVAGLCAGLVYQAAERDGKAPLEYLQELALEV